MKLLPGGCDESSGIRFTPLPDLDPSGWAFTCVPAFRNVLICLDTTATKWFLIKIAQQTGPTQASSGGSELTSGPAPWVQVQSALCCVWVSLASSSAAEPRVLCLERGGNGTCSEGCGDLIRADV